MATLETISQSELLLIAWIAYFLSWTNSVESVLFLEYCHRGFCSVFLVISWWVYRFLRSHFAEVLCVHCWHHQPSTRSSMTASIPCHFHKASRLCSRESSGFSWAFVAHSVLRSQECARIFLSSLLTSCCQLFLDALVSLLLAPCGDHHLRQSPW